jgi:MFS family permease
MEAAACVPTSLRIRETHTHAIIPAMPAEQQAGSGICTAPDKIRPWASLAFRDYRFLWASVLFGNLSTQTRQFVSIWLVFEISGSPLQLGLTGLFQALPLLAIGLFAGAVADSVDRRKLLLATQVANMALALALGFLALSGVIQVWHIYIIAILTSTVNAFGWPTRTALVSNLVPPTHIMNALATLSGSQQVVMMLGPLLAGLSIAAMGAGSTYLVNAAILVPALIALLLMRGELGSTRGRPRVTGKALIEGLRFVWITRVLLAIIVLDTLVMVFGFYQPLMVIFAKDVFHVGSAGLGALLSAPAVGAALATLVLLTLGNVERKGLLVLSVMALYSATVMLFGVSPWFAMALVLGAILGFADSLGLTPRTAMVQLLSPAHMRGRANGMFFLSAGVANNMGFLVMGVMAELIGPRLTMLVGGGIGLSAVLLVWVGWKTLREFRG